MNHPLNNQMNKKALITLTLIAGTMIPLVGCAPASPRSKSVSSSQVDPAIANAQRQRQEALKHFDLASKHHIAGKTDLALEEYRNALELDDKLYASWNNMGQLLMTDGNYADAVVAYQIASRIEPSDPRPEYNIGIAYQKVGWAQDSYTHFQSALDRDSTYLPALRGLIRSAEMLGLGDTTLLEQIRNAQLRETDTQWREYLSTQFYRVQTLIANN